MSYSDSIQLIRQARAQRDAAQDSLYNLQLQYQSLLKQQKKAGNKDVVLSQAGTQAIHGLQLTVAELQNQLNDAIMQLNAVNALISQLNDITNYQNQLKGEVSQLQNDIADIDKKLNDPNTSDEQKTILQQERTELNNLLNVLNSKINDLQAQITGLQGQIAQFPPVDTLQQQIKSLQGDIAQRQDELSNTVKDNVQFSPDRSHLIEATRSKIKEQTGNLNTHRDAVSATIGKLFAQQTPQQLIENWNDDIPIVLLPLRVETKFKTFNNVNQLWVRAFPDNISVVTHEKVLSDSEVAYGIAHWKILFGAGADESLKKQAWQMLTEKSGINRAAWVAQQTKPANWSNAGSLASVDDLQFPTFDVTKIDAWTQAPHSRVMPDRLVLIAYHGGVAKYTVVGQPIDDILILGPAPMIDGENPSLTRSETDNRINFDDDFKWIADFDMAVAGGMGFKLDLDNISAVNGFDQLLVVGIKVSGDETDGKQSLEDLFENHRYSIEGFSLVQQGTPTNNTEETDSAYSKTQTIDDIINLVEKDQVLFTPTTDVREATDGQRLADALGLDYSVFQSVQNSDIRDHTEAIAMNRALYAATAGYFMNSMLNNVVSDASLSELRQHFTNYVTGRGPLAAIKVGKQPYGVLLSSAFSQWKYPGGKITRSAPVSPFYNDLYKFLLYLQTHWQSIVPQLAHVSKSGNAADNLMKVLGLNPTSVEFYQRVAYSADYLQNIDAFSSGGKYFGDLFGAMIEGFNTLSILHQFGYTQTNPNGTTKHLPLLLQLVYQHYQTQLDNKNLVDGEPLSEDTLIKPYDVANDLNFVDWLVANAGNSTKLRNQDFGGAAIPHSLLYMMLRTSLLQESSQSIYKLFKRNNIAADEMIRSRKFMNMSSSPTVSHWEIFDAPVNKLVTSEVSSMPVLEYVHSKIGILGETDLVENLAEHKWGLGILKDMPTARLERAFAEHIDTLSYRLDAWETSLFEQRLQQQRNTLSANGNRRTGVYIGAYGYLENLRPANKRKKVSEDLLPEALRENTDNLYTESGNGGYVQAPTLNHATAAAILRNGYLTNADPANDDTASVNLSSERVRRAKDLLDGIRNGQTLEMLLGYQFERGLHDWTVRPSNPIILSQLTPYFRSKFPITKTKVPQAGKTTGPEETVPDFSVVNGLALARVTAAFPYGIAGLPPLDTDQINAIKKEKNELEDTLDALKDMMSSESAYQLAMGNFDRAAAVMQAISNGHIPPEIDVINSARSTNLTVTNRVVLHFDSMLTDNPWPAVPMSQRALTEPGINNWAGTLLGDPSTIRCTIKAVDKDGVTLKRPDNSDITGVVSLQDLQVQAIDLMYLIRNKLEASSTSELETRVRYVFAVANGLSDDVIVQISFATTDAPNDLNLRSFAEILPLANYLRELVSGSRPLTARDFQPASKKEVASSENPDNIDTVELQGRVQNVWASYVALFSQLGAAVNDAGTLKTQAAVDMLRMRLKAIADAGYVFAFPQSATGFDQAQIDMLTTQGTSVQTRFTDAQAAFAVSMATVTNPATPVYQKVSLLTELAKALLGDDYTIMPRYNFTNTTDITQAYTTRTQLLDYASNTLKIPLPVSEWLHGVSVVRTKMHTLEMVRLLNDTLNPTPLTGEPIQLPYKDKDSWLAIEFPEGTTIDNHTLAYLQFSPQGFDAGKAQCGLLLDDWVETIPSKEEISGIAFNYNTPNSVPPHAILMAVSPVMETNWTWDNLVATILDTVARAKRRAIEPDHIDTMPGICSLLPATMAEFSTSKSSISLDYSMNIKAVMEAVSQMTLTN